MRKIFATLLSAAVLLALILPAAALDADPAVTMTAEGDRAAVTLTLPDDQAEGVTSLRLSFDVQTGREADVSFAFDGSLKSTVQQARYNAAAGRLTVYLSGREALFTDGTLSLGEIRLSGTQNLTATVSLGENALELANGAYGAPDTLSPAAQPVQLAVNATPDQGSGDENDGDQNNGGQTGGDQNNGGQTGGDQNNGGQTGGDQSNGGQTGGDQNNGGQTGGDQNNGGQTGGDQNNGGQTGGNQNNGGQTGGDQNNGGQTGGNQSNGGQTGGDLNNGNQNNSSQTGTDTDGEGQTGQQGQNQTSPATGDNSEPLLQPVASRQSSPWLALGALAAGIVAAVAALVLVLRRRRK